MAMAVTVECEYRLVINGKKVLMTRADMASLRDSLSAILADGAPVTTAAASAPQQERSTDEDDEKLMQLIARGKPFAFVAHELGRTDGACRLRHRKLQSGAGQAAD